MAEQIGTIKELKAIEQVGKEKQYDKRTVVLEIVNGSGEHARNSVAGFTFFGKKVADTNNFVEGEQVKIAYNLEGREYNGKIYTDLAAYKIEMVGEKKSSVGNGPVRNEVSGSAKEQEENLGLPF